MKKQVRIFFYKILLVLLPFIMLFSWIEYQARRLPNGFALKKENFERVHDSISILVLGSSHAMKGINPDFFSCKGFNFSNSSQTLVYDSRLCLKYLGQLPRLKAVIIDISCISFFFDLENSPESWKDYFYYHYYAIRVSAIKSFCPEALTYTALYTKGTINDMVFGKLNYIHEFGDIQANGWEKTNAPADSVIISEASGQKRAQFHQSLIHPENFPEIMSNLRVMLKALSKRKISVFFVSTPVYKTYSRYLLPSTEVQNHRIIMDICRKYKILYYDFSGDCRFIKQDFSDNDHLNSHGAEKFSRLLDSLFIAPLCKSGKQ